MFIKKSVKVLVLVVLVLALSGFTYAFAAANTVPPTIAGDGTGTIGGYVVSNVVYTLNDTPAEVLITNVSFTMSPAVVTGVTVKIRFVTGGTWYPCDTSTATVSCAITSAVTVRSAVSLQVLAYN